MTLREFANRLGADPGYVSKIENGKARNVSTRFMVRVSVAFKVNTEWLQSGKGGQFWTATGDERTKKALPGWSEKRLQRIMAVMDELPDALAAEAVLECIFEGETLKEFQSTWHKVMDKTYPTIPATARLFWNDVYTRVQLAKSDDELRRKAGLTESSDFRKDTGDMKSALPKLLNKVRKLTEPSGMKTKLAADLEVSQARVSEWLSGKHKPAGETTLQLLKWVEIQERQAK